MNKKGVFPIVKVLQLAFLILIVLGIIILVPSILIFITSVLKTILAFVRF